MGFSERLVRASPESSGSNQRARVQKKGTPASLVVTDSKQPSTGTSKRKNGQSSKERFSVERAASISSWHRIAAYVIAVLALGWIGPVIDRAIGEPADSGPGQLLWILLPITAATLLRWKGGDGFEDAGFCLNYRASLEWYAVSISIYPVAMVSAAVVGVVARDWVLADERALVCLVSRATAALVPLVPTAMAEEFGWRGYLTPRLEAAGVSRLANHLTVGMIWGLWHFPYLTVFWNFSDEHFWTLAVRVVIGTTVAAFVYGEIRLRSGSIWPAVLMHTSSNAIASALLDDSVLVQNSSTPWITSPGIDGMIVIVITAVAAAALLATRR